MQNFQLYRTNHLLSGQVKWDIVISSDNGELYISDFNLTPISDIPFNFQNNNIVYNTHEFNMMEYYKNNQGYFYNDYIDSNLTYDWPLLPEYKNTIKQYDDTFLTGCKRMQYKLYNKQFGFLCPLWIEQLYDDLSFDIQIYTTNQFGDEMLLTSKNIKLNYKGIEYHDKFVKYFTDFISRCGLDLGDDRVMNLKFNTNQATINGLDLNVGAINTKILPDLIYNLSNRERPNIEIDNLLINSFKNNLILAKQLFNFNLVFDISDITSSFVSSNLMGQTINIKCKAKIGDDYLQHRDLFVNYTYIPRIISSEENWDIDIDTSELIKPSKKYSDINIYDYMNDDKCLDFINYNKICPSTIHWQLSDNDNYIFNIYDGFAGLIESNNDYFELSHRYEDQPILDDIKYNKIHNNTGWVNILKINKYVERTINKLLNNPSILNDMISEYGNGWVNNLKYSKLDNPIKMCAVVGNNIYNIVKLFIISSGKGTYIDNQKIAIVEIDDNIFIICANSVDVLTYANIKQISYNVNNEILKKINKCLNALVQPQIIYFNKGLYKVVADGPSLDVKEVTYYKSDNKNYVIRYDGYIKPNMVPIDNCDNLFFYKLFTDDSKINKNFFSSGFAPKYPSINYYALSYKNIDYYKLYDELKINKEYKWFLSGRNYIIPNDIKLQIKSDINEQDYIDNEIKKELINKYNFSEIDYIYNLYNKEYDLLNIEDSKYIYDIKMELK